MASILLLAIIIAVGTALLASVAFQFLAPVSNSVLSPLEEKCQQIANQGYELHAAYPNSSLEQLPDDVLQEFQQLDEIWMTQCVSVLPADSLFSIINDVDRSSSLSFGE